MKSSKSNPTFLITGGAGFIGSNTCDLLLNQDCNLIVIDNLSTGSLENIKHIKNKIVFYNSSIEEFDFNLVDKIDIVIHLAAQTSVPLSIKNFYLSSKSNLLTSLKVLDFCSIRKIPLIYASSSAIYGDLDTGDDETSSNDLLSPYSADKLTLETFSRMIFKLNNIPSIGLRFFNVYGPRQDPDSAYSGVISIFAKQIINNKPIKINGGKQTRDFIFVNDVTKCIYNSYEILKKNNICETVNVLSNRSTSIDDLANLMMKIIGKYPEKIYKPLSKGDPLKSIGSFRKMERIFQISMNEITELEKGLIETVNYLKKEKN